jgi:hypothetical protein
MRTSSSSCVVVGVGGGRAASAEGPARWPATVRRPAAGGEPPPLESFRRSRASPLGCVGGCESSAGAGVRGIGGGSSGGDGGCIWSECPDQLSWLTGGKKGEKRTVVCQ